MLRYPPGLPDLFIGHGRARRGLGLDRSRAQGEVSPVLQMTLKMGFVHHRCIPMPCPQVSVRRTEGHPTSMTDLEELGWVALKNAAAERASSLNQQAVLPSEHDERHRQVLHMLAVRSSVGDMSCVDLPQGVSEDTS